MTLEILFDHIRNVSTLEIFVEALNAYLASKEHTIEDRDEEGYTLLIYASSHNRLDLMKIILQQYKANINAINNHGQTALTYTLRDVLIWPWNPAIAEFLLEQEGISVEIGKEEFFKSLIIDEQDEAKRRIYQKLISKGVDITPTLTHALSLIKTELSAAFFEAHITNAITIIGDCFHKAGRLMPALSEYSTEIEEMIHSVVSGLAIENTTKIDRDCSKIVAKYMYENARFLDYFDRAFMRRPPIIISVSLPLSLRPQKSTHPREEEPNTPPAANHLAKKCRRAK